MDYYDCSAETVFYNVKEDELFVFNMVLQKLDITFYNNSFGNNTQDIKKIKYSGFVDSSEEGMVFLGGL